MTSSLELPPLSEASSADALADLLPTPPRTSTRCRTLRIFTSGRTSSVSRSANSRLLYPGADVPTPAPRYGARAGKGSFGQVYKASVQRAYLLEPRSSTDDTSHSVFGRIDKRTGGLVAIKVIDLENAEDEIDDIQQEIQILSQLDSAWVTKCVS